MERVVSAGIFLEFEVVSQKINDFSEEFLACYELDSEKENLYQINETFFLKNYKGLLKEFNDFFCIEDIGCHHASDKVLTWDDIPDFQTLDEFCSFWNKIKRHGKIPFSCNSRFNFNTATGIPKLTWLFYDGIEKKNFNNYYLLYHFEKAVQVAIKNPLGKLIKMGTYG